MSHGKLYDFVFYIKEPCFSWTYYFSGRKNNFYIDVNGFTWSFSPV